MGIITIIGSRQTPTELLAFMRKVAYWSIKRGIIVRSGKAGGADAAAIYGCMDAQAANELNALPEMYIPWSGFGDNDMTKQWDSVQGNNPAAAVIAENTHPAWGRCSQGAKKLHTRNACQILGATLDTPSDIVLYYCKERGGMPTGGTATAVNLATKHGCSTINMLNSGWRDTLRPILTSLVVVAL